jgi:hypothetical protein
VIIVVLAFSGGAVILPHRTTKQDVQWMLGSEYARTWTAIFDFCVVFPSFFHGLAGLVKPGFICAMAFQGKMADAMRFCAGMSIRRRYPVPKLTGIAGTSTDTGSGTQAAVIPVPNTGKMINFGRPVPVIPKSVKVPVPVQVPMTGTFTGTGTFIDNGTFTSHPNRFSNFGIFFPHGRISLEPL